MDKVPQPASALAVHPETTRLPPLRDPVRFPQTAKDVLITLGVAAVYFVAGKLGLRLAFLNSSASAVWPPTGIALAAFLIFGFRVWPGVLLGAFLVNVTTTGTVLTSFGISLGNTLEGVVGSWLVNRFAGGRKAFERVQGVLKFTLLAGILATVISATVGTTTISLGGLAAWAHYGNIWLTWWLGDAVGALVVAPLLILWSRWPRLDFSYERVVEAAAIFLSLYLVGEAVFGGLLPVGSNHYPLDFICLPVLVWAAYRLGPRGAALAVFALAAIATRGTLAGFGPFVREHPNQSLLLLQSFMGVKAVLTMALAALVLERRQHEQALEVLAVSDALTGLANYRRFSAALQLEIERGVRTGREFAVLMLDLDELKKINDRFGHLTGSRAICRVAENLRQNCRTLDTAARFGGDEFAVLLPETDESEARQVADRIVERLAADKEAPPISVSLGISMYPRDGVTHEALVEAADRALYKMKRSNGGRRNLPRAAVNRS